MIVKPNKNGIEKCVKALKNKGLIIYPTETSYAIGCDITDKEAVKKIYKVKKRGKKMLTAIVSDLKMADKYGILTKNAKILIRNFMPGPLTIIVKKKSGIPDLANKDFAFRIPNKKIARLICKKFGKPIVATSANISGKKPIYKISKIVKTFKDNVDVIVDFGDLPKNPVSTIVKVNDCIKIIRKGPIKKNEIKKVLENAG